MVASEPPERYQGKTKLRDKAYESFIECLLTSRIVPGQFLSQRELVEVTGMPLGAIRELIPRLEADRLIETVPQRGMQVVAIDLKLVRDAFQLWIILEKAAAESFVETATDEEIRELAETHEDLMKRARQQVDQSLLVRARALEWELHNRFIETLNNAFVSEIHRVNSVKIQMIRNARGSLTERAALTSTEEQRAVIEALKARDAPGVVAAVEAHLEASLRRALGL